MQTVGQQRPPCYKPLPSVESIRCVFTGGSTFSQALFNSVNIMLGVGMLSIPYALKEVS